MRCARCGTENRPAAKFCDKCGARLAPSCPSCAAENRLEAKFCDSCGTSLTSTPPTTHSQPDHFRIPVPDGSPQIRVADAVSAEVPDGERKTVTALFADIKGSMDLMEDLDPEEARAIVDPALKLMIDAVHRYDGYIVQSTGDGIFALFGAPIAYEDHPLRALYGALRIQEEMRRYASKLREAGNTPLEARVGVNTGEVVVRSLKTSAGHTEYTPIGHSTNLASRMQTLAPTGSIAVTEATQKFCAGYFNFKPLGPTRIKGVTEPVNVFEVIGLGPLRTRLQRAAGRGLTKFVGRSIELDAMKHAAVQAQAGRGQIVAAIAEAGVGKSRLFFEFKALSQADWMVLETFSVSHGKASTYLPLIEMLLNYFGITSEDDDRRRREKIAGRLAILDSSLEDTRPYIFALLGISERLDIRQEWERSFDRLADYLNSMQNRTSLAEVDPRAQRRRTLEAIKRILLRESLNQPLMVIFEDLHWIDEATQEFLDLLADSLASARILLLVNYRPEYNHQWSSKTYYTRLQLDPLGKDSADEMLSALLGDGAELAQLKRLIIERTEGNPFFMEESVQVLLDEGALVRNGAIKLTRPLAELKIPPTVQAILASRIDRLAPDAKELLQTLAVIGREFPLSLIRAVVPKADSELARMLDELQIGEFIYEQPAVGDTEYIFKHALTQEVAYGSLLIERRRVLHAHIAALIESLYADRIEEHVADLAHHYGRSANAAKAVEYCLRACQQSAKRASFAEAVGYFESGLARLAEIPDDDRRAELELDLRNAAQLAVITTRGHGSAESERFALRAVELSRRPGIAWEKSWTALHGIYLNAMVRADYARARGIATQMLEIAQHSGNVDSTAQSFSLLAFPQMFASHFESAAESLDRAISLYDTLPPANPDAQSQRHYTRALSYGLSAWNAWFLGYPDRAQRFIDDAFAVARAANSRAVDELVHDYATEVFGHLGRVQKTRASAEAMATLAIELGDLFRRAIGEFYLGWCDALEHGSSLGVARMRRALADFQATGARSATSFRLAVIAQSLCGFKQYDQALAVLNEALITIAQTGERAYESEVHRTKGEILRATNSSGASQAEEAFRSAIEIARQQKAKSWELRATMSLARLLRDTDRREEARSMLADVYGWFTEGFDTADLKDAKALLEGLG